jgi:hypothetical protein
VASRRLSQSEGRPRWSSQQAWKENVPDRHFASFCLMNLPGDARPSSSSVTVLALPIEIQSQIDAFDKDLKLFSKEITIFW